LNIKKKMDKATFTLSKKLSAVDNKSRLALMGLLYMEKKQNFSELVEETKMDSNKLAYHLNILLDSNLIQKKRAEYRLTNEGKRFLIDLKFIENVERIQDEEKIKQSLERPFAVPIQSWINQLLPQTHLEPEIYKKIFLQRALLLEQRNTLDIKILQKEIEVLHNELNEKNKIIDREFNNLKILKNDDEIIYYKKDLITERQRRIQNPEPIIPDTMMYV